MQSPSLSFLRPSNPEFAYPQDIPERVSCNPIEANSTLTLGRKWLYSETLLQTSGRQKIMNTYAAILRKPPSRSNKGLGELGQAQIRDISQIVWIFLHLFIDREITPEEEPENRLTLSKTLFDYFRKHYFLTEKATLDVYQHAIHCYSLVAAEGFYKQLQQFYPLPSCIAPFQNEAIPLYNALLDGLKTDFPNHRFDKQQVENLGMSALIYVNEKRRQHDPILRALLK